MSQINVNTITGKDGGSAVNFPNGITVTGVVTATSLSQNISGNVTATSFIGNVTGTASTASSLAAGATGADLTLSGNLTVNGTTTTIDTAVTAVDSLAVDGSVGIGLTNPGSKLHVSGTTPTFRISHGTSQIAEIKADTTATTIRTTTNHPLLFATNDTERFRIDQNGTAKFKGPLTEKANYGSITLNGDYNHDLITHGNVLWSDTAAAGAFTLNLRGSATVALNDMMATGESLSFWFAHACHGTTSHYMTAFKVDGTPISGGNIIWAGGSAPTTAAGGSGTKDVYTFTVFKTANATFRAFAAQTSHT